MPSEQRSLIVLNESIPKVHLITIPPNKRRKRWIIQLKIWHNGKAYDNEIIVLLPNDTFTLNYTLTGDIMTSFHSKHHRKKPIIVKARLITEDCDRAYACRAQCMAVEACTIL